MTTVPDEVAFEAFYTAHRRHVLAYCRRRALPADAAEAADETFLVAWRRWDEVPDDAQRAWLYGVARRVLANHHRGDRRRGRLVERLAGVSTGPAPAGPESQALSAEEAERLRRAFARMSEDEQEILRLAAWEGLPHEQIAIALGCTANTSRQRLHRARRHLADEFARTQVRAGRARS